MESLLTRQVSKDFEYTQSNISSADQETLTIFVFKIHERLKCSETEMRVKLSGQGK